jgi:hypothetical protein
LTVVDVVVLARAAPLGREMDVVVLTEDGVAAGRGTAAGEGTAFPLGPTVVQALPCGADAGGYRGDR